MRALAWLLTVPWCAAASSAWAQSACTPEPCAAGTAVEMQFTFYVVPTGQGGEGWPPNVWNGPGPIPSTLQETFFVDPASATGTFFTEPGRQGGSVLGHVAETFTASDITLTTNGQILQQSASGTFSFSGDRASDYGPSGSFFGGLSLPDGGGGSDFASQYAQAPPDWAGFLSTSSYHTDTSLFILSGSFGELDVVPQGQAASVSVPEPGVLSLWALAAAGLLAMHRRSRRTVGGAHRPAQLSGSKRARN